jgi:hypothetical protein
MRFALLVAIGLSFANPIQARAQSAADPSSRPQVSIHPNSIDLTPRVRVPSPSTGRPVSDQLALFMFARIAATDETSGAVDRSRGASLIRQVGLSENGRVILSDIFLQYSRSMHAINGTNRMSASPEIIQQSERKAFLAMEEALTQRLPMQDLPKFRTFLQAKKQNMHIVSKGSE